MPRAGKFCRCAGCLHDLLPEDKYIVCSLATCKKAYHIDICIGGTVPIAEDIIKWICPKCRCESKKAAGDNSATPVRGTTQAPDVNVTCRPKKNLPSSDLKELTTEIRSMRDEMLTLKRSMESLMASSATRIDKRIDELISKLAGNNDRINTLEACYEAENASLKQQVMYLEDKLNKQEQTSLRNQIEIVGLPEFPTENLHHIALVVAQKVGVEIRDEAIDWIERVGPRRHSLAKAGISQTATVAGNQLPRPIVVQLTRRAKRDELLRAAKSRKSILASDLGVGDSASKVFFNERLTRENRMLFREARARAAEAGFKFCWTSNGHINIRRKEGSPAIQIRSSEELAEKLGSDIAHNAGIKTRVPM